MDAKATPTIRVICAAAILLPSVVGMLLHVTVVAAFYKNWKKFRGNCFYLVMMQIIGSNIYSLFLFLYVAFPITLTGVQYLGNSLILYRGPLLFEAASYGGMLIFSAVIAANRLTIFVRPTMSNKIFSSKNTLIMSLAIWLYILATLAVKQLLGCTKLFNEEEFYFWNKCSDRGSGKTVRLYKSFLSWQYYVLSALMCIIYVIVCAKIRTSKKNSARGVVANERKLLIQTIPLCVLLAIDQALFNIIPTIRVADRRRFILVTFQNLVMISNRMITPILLLIFNTDVQKAASSVFQRICSMCTHS